MTVQKTDYASIDEYIAGFPQKTQELLKKLRETVRRAAPDAQEKMSCQMPTFAQYGILLQFAAFKNHIGFFPGPDAVQNFLPELGGYKTSKGTIQFPYGKPIPYGLVSRVTAYCLERNIQKAQDKKKK